MLNRKFDMVLFDLDGTLFDTKESILNAIKWSIAHNSLRPLTDEEIHTFLGPPLEVSLKRYYDFTDAQLIEMIETFRNYYKDVELLKASIYPGIKEGLKELKEKGYKIGLATYKDIDCVPSLFKEFGIYKYFDTLRGQTSWGFYNSKIEIMQQALDDLKISEPSKVVMVGDTEHDFRGAINVGTYFIGMTYGFGYHDMTGEEVKYKEFLGFCDEASEMFDKIRNTEKEIV